MSYHAKKRTLTAALFATLILCAQQPVRSQTPADNEQHIRQLIQASDIVPLDYRQHINIVQKGSRVLISVFKAPDAQPTDCKIDAILMAKRVLDASPRTTLVEVYFYDLSAQDKVLQVDVPTAAVIDYAVGKMSKLDILHAAKLTTKPANSLASSYGGQSYKEIIQKLGVLEGPAQDLRASVLVRIDELTSRGIDTSNLKRQYLHIEDLTRRGQLIAMRHELKSLQDDIRMLSSSLNEVSMSDSNSRSYKLQSMSPNGVSAQ